MSIDINEYGFPVDALGWTVWVLVILITSALGILLGSLPIIIHWLRHR